MAGGRSRSGLGSPQGPKLGVRGCVCLPPHWPGWEHMEHLPGMRLKVSWKPGACPFSWDTARGTRQMQVSLGSASGPRVSPGLSDQRAHV